MINSMIKLPSQEEIDEYNKKRAYALEHARLTPPIALQLARQLLSLKVLPKFEGTTDGDSIVILINTLKDMELKAKEESSDEEGRILIVS